MSKELKGLEIEKNLLQLGLYFVDLQNALQPLSLITRDNIEKELERLNKAHPFFKSRRWFSQSKGVPTVKMIQTLKILNTSVLDFALNISEFNKELLELKTALDDLESRIGPDD